MAQEPVLVLVRALALAHEQADLRVSEQPSRKRWATPIVVAASVEQRVQLERRLASASPRRPQALLQRRIR